jgi:homocitrate synthase NifV
MMPEFVFVDKTLGYALKQKRIDLNMFGYLKRKMSLISNLIFDISFDFAVGLKGFNDHDLSNIRLCIGQDVGMVKAAYELGVKKIKLSVNHAGCDKILLPLSAALTEAQKLNMEISVGCLNVSEYSETEIDFFQKLTENFRLHSVVLHDRSSNLDPIDTYERLLELKPRLAGNLEYGGKNLLGLATGNALGAIKSGIYTISTSIGGIGEFPAFEEVVMSSSYLLKIPVAVPRDIAVVCKEILEGMGLDIPKTKPIIGANIFSHESGIHVDGVMKRSDLYEPFTPEEVGLFRKIVIGKHSGKAAIEQKVKELDISLKPACVVHLLAKVRTLAIKQKAAVIDEQLKELVKEMAVCESACC